MDRYSLYRSCGEFADKAYQIYRRKGFLPWVRVYRGIRERCENPASVSYKYYGGRGIKCLISQKDLMISYFRDKAHSMRHPNIDRIDPDKSYTVDNIQWLPKHRHTKKTAQEHRGKRKTKTYSSQYFIRRVFLNGEIGNFQGPYKSIQEANKKKMSILRFTPNIKDVLIMSLGAANAEVRRSMFCKSPSENLQKVV